MAFQETREVVKLYELRYNNLLNAFHPGGLLASVEVKLPCEALLIPRQVSLEGSQITPFLTARPQNPVKVSPHSAPPPLSDLFGEEHQESPKRPTAVSAASNKQDCSVAASIPASSQQLYYAPENEEAIRLLLTDFVEYHLLHFSGAGNSEFTNLRGQRGEFSEALDQVKRFGHIGQVAVLADADPLRPQSASQRTDKKKSAVEGKFSPATKMISFSPSTLQIFIIDRPLMDTEEVRFIVQALSKLTMTESICAEAANQAPASLPPANPTVSLPQIFGTITTSRVGQTKVGAVLGQGTSAAEQETARMTEQSIEVYSDYDSPAETVIIEDFAEDQTDDPDLAPYVAKYTHISQQQQWRIRESQRHGTATTQAPAVAAQTTIPACPHTPSNKDSTDPVATARAGTATQGVLITSPALVAAAVTASRADGVKATSPGSRGSVVPITHRAEAPTPARVLRHEYSRECIKDYRRVVAADNEIFYHEFERLMSLRCSTPLAGMMSAYVSQNQQLQQPILNNFKYNEFVKGSHQMIVRTPRLSVDEERCTIVKEGIERYVTSRLYHQLYNVCEDEKRQNAMLQSKFGRLENMSAEQLEALPEVERHHVWGQAMFELDGMDFFKSPREKLRCGMRACELLSLAVADILRQRRNARSPGGGNQPNATGEVPLAFGADEFLPCFLLLVLRAQPLSYAQNVCYIEKFRYERLLSPEESYCLATLQSAMMYWLNCKDDGAVDSTTPEDKPAPSSTPSPGVARGSATVAALTKATSGSAFLDLKAPSMTTQDLLPSVRQASYTARANATPVSGSRAENGVIVVPEEAPTVLDVLFGWANRTLVPSTTEREPAGATTAASSFPIGAVVRSDGSVPQTHVATVVGDTGSMANGSLPYAAYAPKPDAQTRARARELLVTQNRTFEQLTLLQIQLIVEEARHMLKESN